MKYSENFSKFKLQLIARDVMHENESLESLSCYLSMKNLDSTEFVNVIFIKLKFSSEIMSL